MGILAVRVRCGSYGSHTTLVESYRGRVGPL